MTPERLRQALAALPDAPADLPDVTVDAEGLAAALDRLAERSPRDALIREATHQALRAARAGVGVPRVVAGVHRASLVRWDPWSSTWAGWSVAEGRPARVRVVEAWVHDPAHARALGRDGRAIEALIAVRAAHDPWPALRIDLPGAPLRAPERPIDAATLGAWLAGALAELARWEAARVLPSPLELDSFAQGDDGRLHLVCLTPTDIRGGRRRIEELAGLLADVAGPGDDAVRATLAGWEAFPPAGTEEAGVFLTRALAEDLAARRHALARRSLQLDAIRRRTTLSDALSRLGQAVPPPRGRGALGVDLEGAIVVAVSDADGVRFGSDGGAAAEVWRPDGTFDTKEARRMVRAAHAAPPAPHLDARIGGAPGFAEGLARWTSAAIALRTLQRLLAIPTR